MIILGDALTVLRTLDTESVDCIVTSPPYYALREYGADGQIGQEPTPQEFIARLVEVFRECRRVLRKSGTCWVNMGDTYAGSGGAQGGASNLNLPAKEAYSTKSATRDVKRIGFKRKELMMMPARLAIALSDDGWYLRSDIIWSKSNPMPSSVKDRPSASHEYIFLLTKSPRYWYDADAIKEECTGNAHARGNGVNPKAKYKTPDGWDTGEGAHGTIHRNGREKGKIPGNNSRVNVTRTGAPPQSRQNESFSAAVRGLVTTRNARTVWTFSTTPYKGNHYATFPEELPRRCILAGCPEGGTVLDPFSGTGTTVAVALKLGRRGIGIELNADYVAQAHARIAKVTPSMFMEEAS